MEYDRNRGNAMDKTLNNLITKFNMAVEQQELPAELGGYFFKEADMKKLVVNQALKYELKIHICFELVFKHCLDERNSTYIPYMLIEEDEQYSPFPFSM
jgi:hypothetical protein